MTRIAKTLFSALFTALFFVSLPCFAQNTQLEESSYVFIPAGVNLEGVLSQSIEYSSVVTGQSVEVILLEDFSYKNNVLASAGSVVSGYITKKNSVNGKLKSLKIKFTSIRTLYNNVIPVNSTVELKYDDSKMTLAANDKIKLDFSQPITIGAK